MKESKYPHFNELTAFMSTAFMYLYDEWPNGDVEALEWCHDVCQLSGYLLSLGKKEMDWKFLAVGGLISKAQAGRFWKLIKKELPELKNVDEYISLYKNNAELEKRLSNFTIEE